MIGASQTRALVPRLFRINPPAAKGTPGFRARLEPRWPRLDKLAATLLAHGALKFDLNFIIFPRLEVQNTLPLVTLFYPYKNMYNRLVNFAKKAIGEITYNRLGTNTYLQAPGPSDVDLVYAKGPFSRLDFFP